jgi:hypothetical protein
VSVLQDDRVNDLSAEDASPPEEILTIPVKFFVGHHPAAFLTTHFRSPLTNVIELIESDSNFCTKKKSFKPFLNNLCNLKELKAVTDEKGNSEGCLILNRRLDYLLD